MKQKTLLVADGTWELDTITYEETEQGFIKEARRIWPRHSEKPVSIHVFDISETGSLRAREFKAVL